MVEVLVGGLILGAQLAIAAVIFLVLLPFILWAASATWWLMIAATEKTQELFEYLISDD